MPRRLDPRLNVTSASYALWRWTLHKKKTNKKFQRSLESSPPGWTHNFAKYPLDPDCGEEFGHTRATRETPRGDFNGRNTASSSNEPLALLHGGARARPLAIKSHLQLNEAPTSKCARCCAKNCGWCGESGPVAWRVKELACTRCWSDGNQPVRRSAEEVGVKHAGLTR